VSGKTVVALEAVSKRYGAVQALDRIDLAVYEGEMLSLLGPSGCGKTTTLNVVAGFVEADEGRVLLDGDDVTRQLAWQRGLGVVFQSYALFPHMSVAENVAFGLRERGMPRAELATRVREALTLVRLPDAGALRPAQLSGGMQQRVALARALVIRPRVLLLDEPLAALDRKLREEMRAELKDIQREVGITTVFVTHDQHEALGLSDRIAVMNAGRIEQLGAPREVYEQPATRFVADFIGASTVLEGRVVDARTVVLAGGQRVDVRLPRALAAGATVRLVVRPERVSVGAAGSMSAAGGAPNVMRARIASVMFLGDHSELRLDLDGGGRLLATVSGPALFQPGDTAIVAVPPDAFLEVP
jgi:spermidine/putrescine ABC transporter ATP-binding subunit